jgi:hypothetical protein
VEVLDLQYNVHPPGLPEDLGRCIVLGRRSVDGDDLAPVTIDAVVWLMSSGYAEPDELSAGSDATHPLRLLTTSPAGDVLVWTEDLELERVLETVNPSCD